MPPSILTHLSQQFHSPHMVVRTVSTHNTETLTPHYREFFCTPQSPSFIPHTYPFYAPETAHPRVLHVYLRQPFLHTTISLPYTPLKVLLFKWRVFLHIFEFSVCTSVIHLSMCTSNFPSYTPQINYTTNLREFSLLISDTPLCTPHTAFTTQVRKSYISEPSIHTSLSPVTHVSEPFFHPYVSSLLNS